MNTLQQNISFTLLSHMNDNTLFEQAYNHPLITQSILQKIKQRHFFKRFGKGKRLITINQSSNHYFILKTGLARAQVIDYKGNDITLQFFVPGEIIIAPLALFKQISPIENIFALTDCEVWALSFRDFQYLFENNIELAEWGRLWMAEQITKLKLRSIQMITEDATTRYIKLMENQPEVLRQAPLKHIASYLGVTDTSLSRIRKNLYS